MGIDELRGAHVPHDYPFARVVFAAIARMLPPQDQSIKQMMGIPPAALYYCHEKARKGGGVIPNEGKQSWGSQAKFRVVVATMGMVSAEMSAYCRKRGLYPEQVKACRRACVGANAKQEEADRARKAADKAMKEELKIVRRELRRKEKALAETVAFGEKWCHEKPAKASSKTWLCDSPR